MQPGDVPATYADIEAFHDVTGFRPATSLADGVRKFIAWYADYHRVALPDG
jgi:UDP-glucuronate 4-epimerase